MAAKKDTREGGALPSNTSRRATGRISPNWTTFASICRREKGKMRVLVTAIVFHFFCLVNPGAAGVHLTGVLEALVPHKGHFKVSVGEFFLPAPLFEVAVAG